MNGDDLNKQFDALKRGAVDLVSEMHSRKLAIPAAALVLAILAAVVLLPSSPTPAPVPPAAVAPAPQAQPAVARVAQVSVIEPASLDEDIPLTSTTDPFTGTSGYKCTRVGSGEPKKYDCEVSDLKVRIICTSDSSTGPCAESEGSTGGTGSAGSAGGSEADGGSGGSGEAPKTGGGDSAPKKTKTTYYTASVLLDGSTISNVEAGTELPKTSGTLVVYAGANDANTKGVFILADGVTASGVVVDETFGSFALAKDKSVTLTDANGVEHKMTLKKLTKVTK